MAIPKTLGIETEYGIVHRGTDEPNPITASSVLINAYLASSGQHRGNGHDLVGWDFVDETANGTEDIWWIDEGNGYPRLWWEASD